MKAYRSHDSDIADMREAEIKCLRAALIAKNEQIGALQNTVDELLAERDDADDRRLRLVK